MNGTKIISTKKIIETVAEFYNVSVKDIKSRCRKKELVKARHIIMYFLREELRNSYPKIGRRIGNRDHATAIYAYAKIKSDIQKNQALEREMESLRAMFRGQELRVLSKPEEIVKEKTIAIELRWKRMLQRLRITSPSLTTLEREKSMLEEWRLGKTLAQIGREWKITRERVRQIIMIAILREIAGKMNEGFEIDVKEFFKQEKTKHNIARDKRLVKLKTKRKKEKPKRWSRYYIQCSKCGTSIIKHHSNGYCKNCYSKTEAFKNTQKASRLKNIEKRKKYEKEYLKEYYKRPEIIIKMKKKANITNFGGNRELAITRDNGCCRICNMSQSKHLQIYKKDIEVLHINSKKDHNLKNLITLCSGCSARIKFKKETIKEIIERK